MDADIQQIIDKAFLEDLKDIGDITSSAIFSPEHRSTTTINARENGVVSGLAIAIKCFNKIDQNVDIKSFLKDGERVCAGEPVLQIAGPTLSILKAERTALNFMGHLSGIATQTAKYMDAIRGTKTRILATRKTLPGLRALQKQAVIDGGGEPHRYGLYDAILIKDNHIAACGGCLKTTLEKVLKNRDKASFVEIEVDTIDQLKNILELPQNIHPTRILLDNMAPAEISTAIALTKGKIELEASGNITLENVFEYAQSGVDIISSGALTHSVRNFDFGLDMQDA